MTWPHTRLTLAGGSVLLLAFCTPSADTDRVAKDPPAAPKLQHVIAAGEEGHFAGWPANNGSANWTWGNEILVGFSWGPFEEKKGHNIVTPDGVAMSLLARSVDGGRSWTMEDPEGYVGDGGEATDPPGGIDFASPGFAFRVEARGYLASKRDTGAFFYSYDRGKTWKGPHTFGDLLDHPDLEGLEFTPRTDYLVLGPEEMLVFLSARDPERSRSDKVFVARTTDGGKTFELHSWVVPWSDPYRAVMPATVRVSDTKLVTAIRRRTMDPGDGWVDAYVSEDTGASWSLLSRVGETGGSNGNPPGLVRLTDGRLFCAYGNRDRRDIVGRFSLDDGATWEPELVLRDGYHADSYDEANDLGYPRVTQNADGQLVVTYYWPAAEPPHTYIAATIFDPGEVGP
jgi:hypothetical protein